MSTNVSIKGEDLNRFYEMAREDIASLFKGAAVNAAVIYNDSGSDVTFYVYNYIDTVYWVSAMKARVAAGSYGTVAASGAFFKIHPNDKASEEFLVAPHHAYVYHGPGNLEAV
jgi:hypothetical protein